jgi:hypothetical protein
MFGFFKRTQNQHHDTAEALKLHISARLDAWFATVEEASLSSLSSLDAALQDIWDEPGDCSREAQDASLATISQWQALRPSLERQGRKILSDLFEQAGALGDSMERALEQAYVIGFDRAELNLIARAVLAGGAGAGRTRIGELTS